MASQWIPPLPPSYEARWDPNQRAYFFINHQDKSTTWVDPRFTQQPASNAHQTAAKSLNQSGFGARSQGAPMIPMNTKSVQFGSTTSTQFTTEDDEDESESEMDFDQLFTSTTGSHEQKVDIQKLNKIKQQFPSAPEEVIKSFLLRHNNSEMRTTNQLHEAGYKREVVGSHPAPKVVDMTERLRAMFPTANRDLLKDILAQSDNDEKQARLLLEGIGYKATFPATHKDTSRTTSPARSKSPAKQASPARRPTSPAKPQISEAEKKKMVTKVKGLFPQFDRPIIEMALQVCNYDESRVRPVLERVGDKSKAQPSRPTTSTSTSRTRSVSPTPDNDTCISHGLEPVVMSYDAATSRPSTSDKGKSSRSTTPASRPQSKSRSPTPKSATKQKTQTQRAKKVTQMSETVLSSTIDTLNHLNNLPSATLTSSGSVNQSDGSMSKVVANGDKSCNVLDSTLAVLNRLSGKMMVPCCDHPHAITPGNQPNGSSSNETQSEQSWAVNGTSERGPARSVVSSQPQGSAYESPNRTPAIGPDPSMRFGPNKELLLTDYTAAIGPNPEMRQGPDPCRVQGSHGAAGPDWNLHCGPQMGLDQGPGDRALLITAI